MGAHPELRRQAKEVSGLAKEAIADVEALSPDERVAKLQALSPEMFAALHEKHEHKKVLADLEGAEHGVVMRFAPNPSGPLHIGHARAAALNDAYVKQYGGRYILRIEDTDPKRVNPDAYEMVKEDIRWLGLGITETVTQSDRLPIYYDLCRHSSGSAGHMSAPVRTSVSKNSKTRKSPAPAATSRWRLHSPSGRRYLTVNSRKVKLRYRSRPTSCTPTPQCGTSRYSASSMHRPTRRSRHVSTRS